MAVVATVATAGMASPLLAGAIVGASAGFTAGAVGTLAQGGNIGQALGAGLIQGSIGAITGGVGGAVGAWAAKAGTSVLINSWNVTSPALTGFASGAISGAASGFASGAVGAALTGEDWLQGGINGAIMGGAIGAATGTIGAFKYAKKNGIDPWTGKPLKGGFGGNFPEANINTQKGGNLGKPNSVNRYTTKQGKPITDQFYNNKGKLEFEIDYKPHNMGGPHGHNYTNPGVPGNGHLPENHIPFMRIPQDYFRLRY